MGSAVSQDHLTERAREILTWSDEERIRYIKTFRWIGYTRAREIRDRLEDLLGDPTEPHYDRGRAQNLLIVGNTFNGKTQLARRFQRDFPARDNADGETIYAPVVSFHAPSVADEGRFYEEILKVLFAPYRKTDKASQKQDQAIGILQETGTKMLMIDEFHHLLTGTARKQGEVRNVIKYIGNELKIPLVALGTKEALRFLRSDPHLDSRFDKEVLPNWKKDAEYGRLLVSFEKTLPLAKPSNLTANDMATRLLTMSEGLLGELSKILTRSAVIAIRTGTERIDEDALNALKWVPVSKRRAEVEKLL